MIKLFLKRIAFKETYTIGKLYIDGVYFCDTLEDKVRPKGEKVYSKTAIPAGTYDVIVNYSPRFKKMLPRLLNVPNFEGVLIHSGNTAEDSSGCILVGKNNQVGRVNESRATMERLMQILTERADNIILHIQ